MYIHMQFIQGYIGVIYIYIYGCIKVIYEYIGNMRVCRAIYCLFRGS